MAAGQQQRFGGSTPKQLLELPAGETVLARQLRQIRQQGYDGIVVTQHREIGSCVDKWFTPSNNETLCNSILSTERFWDKHTIILLGDVIFTRKGIETVFSCRSPVNVIGNEAEMYALVFTKSKHDQVKECLKKASELNEAGIAGKLRYFYKVYANLPEYGPELESAVEAELGKGPYTPQHLPNWNQNVLVWLRDKTNDIDSMHDYLQITATKNWRNGCYG